jgi:hypothetical protein
MSQEQGRDPAAARGLGPAPAVPAAPWSAPDSSADPTDVRWISPDGGGGPFASAPPSDPAMEPPSSGGVPLRPLGVGDILDGTFSTIRRNPRATVGLALLLVLVQQALVISIQLATGGVPTAVGTDLIVSLQLVGGFGGILGSLLSALVGAVLTGMLVVVVSEDVLGRRVTAGEVWRRVRPRIVALVVAGAIAGVLPYVGLIFFLVPGAILWAAWALTTPALVLEGLGPIQALRRSWRLAWPSLMRVWAIRALSVLLAVLIEYVVAVPFAAVGGILTVVLGTGEGDALPVTALVPVIVGEVVAGTLTAPFLAGVLALLYLDRRMRAEGLDLVVQRQARAARLADRAPAPPAMPPVPAGSWGGPR